MPAVLGHEAAGTVEAVGELVTYVKSGDPVIMCLSVFCGHCEYCLRGQPNLCTRTDVVRGRDEPPRLSQNAQAITQMANLGGYAEMMLVHEHSLVKVDADVPFDRLALIGCGATTGLAAARTAAGLEPGSRVAAGVSATAAAGKPVENVSGLPTGGSRDMRAAIALRSRPPLRNAPRGTSLRRRMRTDSSIRSRRPSTICFSVD